MSITRRTFSTSALSFALAAFFPSRVFPQDLGQPTLGSPTSFTSESVITLARELSNRPYRARRSIPQPWLDLTYDQYKSIWFDHRKALWNDTDRTYRLDLFSPGLYYPHPIQIGIVENGMTRPLQFDFSLFDKTDQVPDLPHDDTLGYSGFRLRTELEKSDIYQEFCVFQGASYFRAIAKGQIYGLSARGLAIKTASPEGEEFPDFTHFWIEAPASDQHEIVIHALLDSPSVSGSYKFTIHPGDQTLIDVESTLFPPSRIISHWRGSIDEYVPLR